VRKGEINMRRIGKAVFVSSIIAAIVLLFCSQAAINAAARINTPDSIGECLSKSDGSTVTLTGVQVMWQGRSGKSFAIKEWTEKWPINPRILVVSSEQLPVEAYWTINATGTLQTLSETKPDGTKIEQRAILVRPADIQVLCDRNGKPAPVCIFTNGVPPTWMSAHPLTDFIPNVVAAAAEQTTVKFQTEDIPPLPDTPEPAPPTPGSKDSLKCLPDGALVSMNGAIAVLGPNWLQTTNFFYVERSDRSFGIKVRSSILPEAGELVDITGRLATVGGERTIIAESVTILGYNYPLPAPVGMNNRSLGGGMVDAFTPAVGNGSGPNNTGLIVKIWGKVTSADTDNRIYELTDGSTDNNGQAVTVKVYDNNIPFWSPLPTVGDFHTVYGVSGAEVTEGSSTSIRVLHQTEPTIPSYQSGNGTISGTITAVGADGKTIRVYCAKASTTATFSGNTASYTLDVPYGDHAVTTSLLGYKTTTQLAAVSSGSPTATCNFILSTLQRRVDVVSSPTRIPPDGVTTATIITIVRDEEGKRYANQPVTWNVDLGTIISSDATTNAVGEAKLVLQAPTCADTGSISATCDGITAMAYIEFASPTAPSVRILTPILNENISGVVTIKLHASDSGGIKPGIHQIAVTVDGQPLSAVAAGNPSAAWATYTLPNGTHTIKAAASDGDLEYGYSPAVTITTSNGIYNVAVDNGMFDANDSNPTKRVTTISAHQDQSTNWEIEITKRGASSPTRVFTGTGTAISATWDGTNSQGNPAPPGRYKYTIHAGQSQGGTSAQSYDFSLWDYVVFLRTNPDAPTALLVEGNYFDNNYELFDIVEDACEARGFQVINIPEKYATWDRFHFFMNVYEPTILYITTHGSYEIRTGTDCLPALLP
jgi:hypothetical protein